jgi:peroxiredoxin (alkyl hydroperoxide reductase subunit C)
MQVPTELYVKGGLMSNMKEGCVKPARGPIVEPAAAATGAEVTREVTGMRAMVGKEAPDFEATAFLPGKGFTPITLSDYRGKWIVLCFYPGDFTFV